MMNKYLSVCIPTYEMNGFGHTFLKQSLDVLVRQTFTDFEVVISDHSRDNHVKELCGSYKNKLDVHYHRNPNHIGSSSANMNNAIRRASGRLIKILFQDDFLSSPLSLKNIVDAFDINQDHWLISACEVLEEDRSTNKPFFPRYNDRIHLGNNTIGSPSVLTITNERPLLFDEHLIWLMDCDYYRRCFETYGPPKILNIINIVNRVGQHQVTNTLANEPIRKQELQYIQKKYHEPLSPQTHLGNRLNGIKRFFVIGNYRTFIQSKHRQLYKKSYSQVGEDLIVKFIFNVRGIHVPSYIDIGAHDPVEINNTKALYDQGSLGINIEPNPVFYKKFQRQRRRDINLNVGVSDKAGEMDFYVFNSPALSTFSKEEAEKMAKEPGLSIIQTIKVPVLTVQMILDRYFRGRFPDFLNIDVEGWDERILRSIDFQHSSPKVICIETISYSTTGRGEKDTTIADFLKSRGYLVFADTNINTIFVKKELWEI